MQAVLLQFVLVLSSIIDDNDDNKNGKVKIVGIRTGNVKPIHVIERTSRKCNFLETVDKRTLKINHAKFFYSLNNLKTFWSVFVFFSMLWLKPLLNFSTAFYEEPMMFIPSTVPA